LAVAIIPVAILIDLIRRHDDDRTGLSDTAYSLEQMGCSQHIGFECLDRPLIACSYDRLRGQVKDEVRLDSLHRRLDRCPVADVPDDVLARGSEASVIEQRRAVRWLERDAGDAG